MAKWAVRDCVERVIGGLGKAVLKPGRNQPLRRATLKFESLAGRLCSCFRSCFRSYLRSGYFVSSEGFGFTHAVQANVKKPARLVVGFYGRNGCIASYP